MPANIDPVRPTDAENDSMEKLFREVADDKMEIGWSELKQILDQSLRHGEPESINRPNNYTHLPPTPPLYQLQSSQDNDFSFFPLVQHMQYSHWLIE